MYIDMNLFSLILPLVNTLFLVASGIYLLTKRRKTFFYPLLGVSCFVLSIIEFSNFMVFVSGDVTRALFWQRWALGGVLFLPISWNLISLMLARQNYRASIKKRAWYFVILFIITFWFLANISKETFINSSEIFLDGYGFSLGNTGRNAFIFLLLTLIAVLIDLENTYSYSRGSQKQGIKSAIRGISIPVGAYFILSSFVVLFSFIDTRFTIIGSVAITIGFILVTRAILKYGLVDTDVHIGRQAVYTSGALIIIGTYLLMVGLVAKLFTKLGVNLTSFISFLAAFLVFFSFIAIVFSASLKRRLKTFVDRSFYKDKYDYRSEWANMSERLGTILNIGELTREVKNLVTLLLNVDSVELVLDNRNPELMQWLLRYGKPISVDELLRENPALYEENKQFLESLDAHIIVSLNAKQKILGMMAVGRKLSGGDFSSEDSQLLKVISRQVAITVLNISLSEELIVSREMENLHKISSFMIHDLKNCVSMLSMIMQNADNNFDNPEFKKDSLFAISGTINKMNNLMQKLSTLPKKLELNPKPQNLNVLIDDAISKSKIEGMPYIKLIRLLNQVPQISIDSEYIQKVILNLILNALESMPKGGNLTIQTNIEASAGRSNGNYVQMMVADTGAGMSLDFIRQHLFRPFQSSKRKGLGIGLFQCKAIIEAHGGEISVESEEGKGTKFTVRLPVK